MKRRIACTTPHPRAEQLALLESLVRHLLTASQAPPD